MLTKSTIPRDRISENDISLIEEALSYDFTRSFEVHLMVERADTDEAKQILDDISTHYYHVEEYYAGLL